LEARDRGVHRTLADPLELRTATAVDYRLSFLSNG
jgi:hypothetical protein